MNEPIVFLGTNISDTSIHCLSRLLSEDYNVVAVITRRRTNAFFHWLKERIICFFIPRDTLADIAEKASIPYFVLADVNSASSEKLIGSLQPALLCTCVFDQILKKNIIAIPTLGAINVHPSLLPQNRGPDPYFWAVKNREPETGVTVHFIDEGIDTGDIIAQKTCPIPDDITIPELHDRLALMAGNLLASCARAVLSGTVERKRQGSGNRRPLPGESDYCIDITQHAKQIYHFVKAVNDTGPGALLKINDKKYYIANAIDFTTVPNDGGPAVRYTKGIVSVSNNGGMVRLACESLPQKMVRLLGLKKVWRLSGIRKNLKKNTDLLKSQEGDRSPETRITRDLATDLTRNPGTFLQRNPEAGILRNPGAYLPQNPGVCIQSPGTCLPQNPESGMPQQDPGTDITDFFKVVSPQGKR